MLSSFAASLRCPMDLSFNDDVDDPIKSDVVDQSHEELCASFSSAIGKSIVVAQPPDTSKPQGSGCASKRRPSLKSSTHRKSLSSLSGKVSPSGVAASRRNSTPVAVTPGFSHPKLSGRPTMVLQPAMTESETETMDSTTGSISSLESSFIKATLLPSASDDPVDEQGFLITPTPVDPKLINDDGIISGSFSFDSWNTRNNASVADQQEVQKPAPPEICDAHHAAENADGLLDYSACAVPPPLRAEAWKEVPAETVPVRGPTYHADRKKVPSQPSAMRLFAVDLIRCDRLTGVCSHPHERVQTALRREAETGRQHLPEFVFAVNLCIPGSSIYHNVFYFGTDDTEEIENQSTPFGRLMHRFIHGDDEFRNSTFKLIPRIASGGNFIVRNAVGSKPTLLGKSVRQTFDKSDRFMEVIVDIASDPFSQRIVKLVLGFAKSLVVDMMFVLEGTDEETLPERILGGARLEHIDFKQKDGDRDLREESS